MQIVASLPYFSTNEVLSFHTVMKGTISPNARTPKKKYRVSTTTTNTSLLFLPDHLSNQEQNLVGNQVEKLHQP